jgi:hypothetical protein
MKNGIRNLIIAGALVAGIFGISNAQEAEASTAPAVVVGGEFSTDVTFGDATAFTTPYTGIKISGDGWELSTNLSDDNVNVEEAKYSWSITDAITATFGSQAEPYGIAWGLHRPSNNSYVSAPRDHNVSNGVGVAASAFGVGVDAFYGDDSYYAARLSYGISAFGINSTVGLSVNSDDAQLVDVSSDGSFLGLPYETSLEYDLAAEDESGESSPSYWLRGVVTPDFAKGAFGLIGYNSDEEVLYGVGYNCSDNVKVSSELSGDGDTVIRASYSF